MLDAWPSCDWPLFVHACPKPAEEAEPRGTMSLLTCVVLDEGRLTSSSYPMNPHGQLTLGGVLYHIT
jgi:hypothetical protein